MGTKPSWFLVAALGVWGCGGEGETSPTDAALDASGPGWVLEAPGVDVGGQLVVLHWSDSGGAAGEPVVVGTWPEGAETFPLSLVGLASPPAHRMDLSLVGESGTLSFAWLVVADAAGASNLETAAVVASAPSAMLVELSEVAAPNSWAARLLNGPVAAGVHVIDIREYTQSEVDALTACMANAVGDPELECPALREHVSLADPEDGQPIQLAAGDVVPDLS
jgi:hypothetical protein